MVERARVDGRWIYSGLALRMMLGNPLFGTVGNTQATSLDPARSPAEDAERAGAGSMGLSIA